MQIDEGDNNMHMQWKLARFCCLVALASALGSLGNIDPIGRVGAAELAKQGSFSNHDAWTGVIKDVLVLGEEHVVYNYSFSGVVTNDAGEGVFHNSSSHCLGMGSTVGGRTSNRGNCVYTDLDGDQIFDEWQDEGTEERAGGSGRLIGGTGKYAGIEGQYEYERIELRPAAEGTFQGYTTKMTGDYRLP